MREGRFSLEDIEAKDTKTKIEYLLSHEELREEHPEDYELVLRALIDRHLEESGAKKSFPKLYKRGNTD